MPEATPQQLEKARELVNRLLCLECSDNSCADCNFTEELILEGIQWQAEVVSTRTGPQ